MARSLELLLDLGDVFTKALTRGAANVTRLRFPSAIARRLLQRPAEATDLLLGSEKELPRTAGFQPSAYPRTRSYRGAEEFIKSAWQVHKKPVPRARYAGWLAAAYGADRQLLGLHPTQANIDALVHKVFLKSATEVEQVKVVFVVDAGAKARQIAHYAAKTPRKVEFLTWKFGRTSPQRVTLTVHAEVADAADCAARAMPEELRVERVQRLLLIDIGYLRTKLAIVSMEGCEHQEQVDGLGVADCVRRILRDEQDSGLVEDEFAVMHALEQSSDSIEVAGRRYQIGRTLQGSRRGLEEELARIAERVIIERCSQRGLTCHGLAVIGGGSAIVGKALATRLKRASLGIRHEWVTPDPSFVLLDGARRIQL